jgi:hypothetical protein
VFVPLCTLFAIMGATAVQMNKKNKKPTSWWSHIAMYVVKIRWT